MLSARYPMLESGKSTLTRGRAKIRKRPLIQHTMINKSFFAFNPQNFRHSAAEAAFVGSFVVRLLVPLCARSAPYIPVRNQAIS